MSAKRNKENTMDAPYITLVFRNETEEEKKVAGDLAQHEFCRAWSKDHETLRVSLIEEALNDGDIEKAQMYIREANVTRFLSDLG